MASTPEEFLDLMRRVQEGDEQAAEELHASYGEHILRVVRRRLHHPLRNRFDSCDFVQSVWKSFFARVTKTCQFDSPQALDAYLQKMARGKVADAYRKGTQTARHNCRNEHSLHEPPGEGGEGALQSCLAAPTPTPSKEAAAHECWENLTQGKCELDRQILALRREGCTYEEIAARLPEKKLTPKRIQRLLRRLKPGRAP